MKKLKTAPKKVKKLASKKRVTTKMPNVVVNNREYKHTVTTTKSKKIIEVGRLIKNRMNELGAGPSEVGKMTVSQNYPKGLTRQHVNSLTHHILDNQIELMVLLSKALDFNVFKEIARLLEPEIQNNRAVWIRKAEAAISTQGKDSKRFVESIEKAKKKHGKEFAEKSKGV
jgi:hypothetical protein